MHSHFCATFSALACITSLLIGTPSHAAKQYFEDSVRRDTDSNKNGDYRNVPAASTDPQTLSILDKVLLVDAANLISPPGAGGANNSPFFPWVIYGQFTNKSQYPLTISLTPSNPSKAKAENFSALAIINNQLINSSHFIVPHNSTFGWVVHGQFKISASVTGTFKDEDGNGLGLIRSFVEKNTGLPSKINPAWNGFGYVGYCNNVENSANQDSDKLDERIVQKFQSLPPLKDPNGPGTLPPFTTCL